MPNGTFVFIVLATFTIPVNVGFAKGDFKSKAFCVSADIGLLASEVLLTFANPTINLVIPFTVPVNDGLAIGAFKFRAVWVADDTGPVTVPVNVGFVNVGLAKGAFKSRAVLVSSDMGLLRSEGLSTFANPTIDLVTPILTPSILVDPLKTETYLKLSYLKSNLFT